MSKGYTTKKKKQIKRQRRARKKYKNFSCKTCARVFCGVTTPPFGVIITRRENCPNWRRKDDTF